MIVVVINGAGHVSDVYMGARNDRVVIVEINEDEDNDAYHIVPQPIDTIPTYIAELIEQAEA